MRVAGSADLKTFGEPIIHETPQDFDQGMQLLSVLAERVSGGDRIDLICGGVPGVVDQKNNILLRSPHLPKWEGKKMPVNFLENDTALVGLGEAIFGAGKGDEIVVYVTVSTGVGGVRIVEGKIDKRRFGFEPGHQLLKDGVKLEELVSGSAFLRRYGRPAFEISDSIVWEEAAKALAMGLHNSILHWSPDALILGGQMIVGQGPSLSLESVKQYLSQSLTIFPELPIIKKAALGDLGGLWGAMAYLTNRGYIS